MTTALLLSGGMDSTCIAYWKKPDYGVKVDYGHNAAAGEIRAAGAVCEAIGITHVVVKADISHLGSGDLVSSAPSKGAPASEWWPYRNQFLLTIAAMKAFSLSVTRLLIGALHSDGFHSDGTPAFVERMQALFELQEGGLNLAAPAIELTAVELVRKSAIPLDILAWSHSCHVSDIACGYCRGCRKHFETMKACFSVAY